MKALLVLMLITGIAIAQQPQSQSLLQPIGSWPICAALHASGILCNAGYTLGQETYMLTIPAADTAVAYRYMVTATLVADGTQIVRTGTIDRADNWLGQTIVVLSFGGVVKDWTIKVDGLVVVSNAR